MDTGVPLLGRAVDGTVGGVITGVDALDDDPDESGGI